MSDLTAILRRLRAGDPQAHAALFALVYAELHRIAGRQLRADAADRALTPTELVHETYLRLFAGQTPAFADRTYFFAAAAQAMRRAATARRAALRIGRQPRAGPRPDRPR
jgi:hypothetical protein